MKKTIKYSSFLIFLLFFTGYLIYCQFDNVAVVEAELGGRCSPIVLVPESPMVGITRHMFIEDNYEIAIFPSPNYSEKYITGFLICKKASEYRCYLKRLRIEDIIINNELSFKNNENHKLEVVEKQINPESAEILVGFLKQKIIKAKYEVPQGDNRIYTTNNVTYDVYVRGASGDEYDHYSASVIDPVRKNGQSCSVILFALIELALADDDGANLKSIDKLTNYLKSVMSGDNTIVDPFTEIYEAVDEPELDLPP